MLEELFHEITESQVLKEINKESKKINPNIKVLWDCGCSHELFTGQETDPADWKLTQKKLSFVTKDGEEEDESQPEYVEFYGGFVVFLGAIAIGSFNMAIPLDSEPAGPHIKDATEKIREIYISSTYPAQEPIKVSSPSKVTITIDDGEEEITIPLVLEQGAYSFSFYSPLKEPKSHQPKPRNKETIREKLSKHIEATQPEKNIEPRNEHDEDEEIRDSILNPLRGLTYTER